MNRYDNYKRCTLTTRIRHIDENGWYAFEDTVFYGEKGGMPDDVGTINNLKVTGLKWVNNTLYHQTDGLLADPIVMQIDEKTRRFHAAMQTALHILDHYYLQKDIRIITTNCHAGHEYYEIDKKPVTKEELQETEVYMAQAIQSATPVTYRYVKGSEYNDPAYMKYDTVRIVDIGTLDSQPCGTPHVSNTLEIASFLILKTEATNRGTRIYFTCGSGTETRLKQYASLLEDLQTTLQTAIFDIPQKVNTLKTNLKETNTTLQNTLRAWMEYLANNLPNETIIPLDLTDENALRILAQIMIKRVSHTTFLLTDKKFVILSPEKKARDIYRKICEAVPCQGGGSVTIVTAECDENIEDTLKALSVD